ncbi:hypothetical protein HK105_201567 [Polyrhizophydium stewartii]|uniref:Cation-transporting P-type ATPase N-terminal domain-containing protein n=1 Tax=Polyrhizophydium stewartii TaxID=2732419 RepID=A0ABR4NGS2_9FUNG
MPPTAKIGTGLFARHVAETAIETKERRAADAAKSAQERAATSRAVASSIASGAAAAVEEKSRLAPSVFHLRRSSAAREAPTPEVPSRRRRFEAFGGIIKKSASRVKSSDNLKAAADAPGSDGTQPARHGDTVVRIDEDSANESHAEGDGAMNALNRKFDKLELNKMTDHTLSFDKLLDKLKTKADPKKPQTSFGISEQDATSRIEVLGTNTPAPRLRVPLHVKFMECLTNLFNLLLFVAGITYLILYGINPTNNFESVWIGCTLITVAFIYAGIEFYELQKITAILESFKLMIPTQAVVMRGGKRVIVDSTQIVPGDVLYLRSGDKVTADAVLFHSTDMRVDISSLTGESEPLLRHPKLEGSPEGTDPLDAPHLLFSTDVVVSGEGYAVVVQTGRDSILGKLSRITQTEQPRKSPLSGEIRRFCKTISSLAGVTAVLFFFVALLRGRNFTYAATFSIGILLAWVPQGLPLTVTMVLAISGRRMAEQKVLVKDLHAVETLGSITMLATDKTGTLTKNEMTVMNLWTGGVMWYAGPGGAKSTPKGQKPLRLDASGVAQMLHVCVTCTRARFERTDVKVTERAIVGDATEVGLLRFAGERLANIDKVYMYPKILEIPFTSETKTHLTIHRKAHNNGGLTLHIKGAPERVWESCTTIWVDGKPVPIDDAWRSKFRATLDELGGKGSRVLGLAMLQMRGDKYPDNWKFDVEKRNFPTTELTFLGIVGLEDPPKEEVPEAVAQMRQAGIKVLMITGDNPVTAEAIARQVNMFRHETVQRVSRPSDTPVKPSTGKEAIVVTGHMLSHLTDDDWFNVLDHDEIIFARTLPTDKLEIVKRAQSLGHTVAVTGDGVNDSAALKKADLGIAMNRTGSDISKESAKMILLDDNFASTVRGIQEGRLIFTNLKKAVRYSLTHLLPEILPYLLYVVVPIPLALTPTQILAVDLGFEILMTMSFTWEPAEDMEALMSMPPRKPVTHQSALAMHNIMQRRKELTSSSQLNLASLERRRQSNLRALDDAARIGLTPLGGKPDDELMDSTMLLNEIGVMGDADPNLEMQIKVLNTRLRNRYGHYIRETKHILTSLEYWKMQYAEWRELTSAGATNERLVDSEVMMYSYLEGGLIEFAGAITTYFAVFWFTFGVSSTDARHGQIKGNLQWKPHSPPMVLQSGIELLGPEQFEALKQVQSVYYLSIFIIQIWNLFACKTRYTLPFRRNVVSNKHTWTAIGAGAVFAGLIVYTPVTNGKCAAENSVFLTSMYLDPLYLLIPMAFGALLYVYSTLRLVVARNVRLSNLFSRFTPVPAAATNA